MLKRKNTLVITLILVFCTLLIAGNSLVFSQSDLSKRLFETVRRNYTMKFPEDFIATVNSETMEEELKEVPDYEKINPDKPFSIKFIFIQEYGERIIVENACMLTRNKFQDYLEVYKSFRTFIDPTISTESFFRQYKWDIISNNRKYYVVKMSKRGLPNEYYQIYIEKNNMLMVRTLYYKDLSLRGRVDIDYINIGKYVVPHIIKGYTDIVDEDNKTERKEFSIELSDFKLNLGLTVDDILGDEGVDC